MTPGPPIRVLLVDDDPAWALRIEDLLREEPQRFSIKAATGVQAALSLLARETFDVALVDYWLGPRTGVELLRSDAMRHADLPNIMLSNDDRKVDEALAAGADDCLMKRDLSAKMLPRALRYAVERRRAAAEQRKSQLELDHIFNLSPDMLCTANFEGYFTRTNATWERVLGYSAEELQGAPFISFVHPDDVATTQAELGNLSRGATTINFLNRYRTKQGSYRWIEWRSKADLDEGIIYAVARDQTDHRLLEQQARQSQKMEAVGLLAGGVAHDFNNILTAISGFSELGLEHVPPDHPVALHIHEVLKACGRASTLTRQLLAFSRKQILAPEVLDLGVVVTRMTAMLSRIIGEDIDLTIRAQPQLGLVSADRGQIEQIVLNLAVNARDAMPSGGRLAIELANVELDDTFVGRHPGASVGAHVMLAVSDSGCGMTEAVRSRLFEPFFTTKELGKGSGLGLATVYGIVKQSGGSIWVYSEPGVGTTFKIYLPRTEQVRPGVDDSATPIERLDGGETVLVVEDQVEVRQIVQLTLQRRGYNVIEASGPAEAEARLRQYAGSVDLLLTDVVMPQMSGSALADRLKQHRPDLRVLYMSGYTDDAVVRHGVLSRDTAFLEKPFTATGLLRAVRAVLDTPDER